MEDAATGAGREWGGRAVGALAARPWGPWRPGRGPRRGPQPCGTPSLSCASKLLEPVLDRANGLVAHLLARLVGPDRALLRGDPVGEACQRRLTRQWQGPPGRFADHGQAMGHRCRDAARWSFNALGGEQLSDEFPKHDRLAVGDEIGVARGSPGGAEN